MASSMEAESGSHIFVPMTSSATRLEIVVPAAAVSIDPDPAPIPVLEPATNSAAEPPTPSITAADLLAHGLPTISTLQADSKEVPVVPQISRHLENDLHPTHVGYEMPFGEAESSTSAYLPPVPTKTRAGSAEEEDHTNDLSEEVDYDMPQWFLDNCVKTAKQLREKEVNLVIRSGEQDDSILSKGSETYEVESVVYEPLRAIGPLETECKEPGDYAFKFDAVYLRYPIKVDAIPGPTRRAAPVDPYSAVFAAPPPEPSPPVPYGTVAFLSVLVEQFAKDSGSDLITLTLADLRDLVAEFAQSQDTTYGGSGIDYELVKAYVKHVSSKTPGDPFAYVDPYGYPKPEKEEIVTGVSEELGSNVRLSVIY